MRLWKLVEGQPPELIGLTEDGSVNPRAFGVKVCECCNQIDHVSFSVMSEDGKIRYEMQIEPDEIQQMDEFAGRVLQAEQEKADGPTTH